MVVGNVSLHSQERLLSAEAPGRGDLNEDRVKIQAEYSWQSKSKCQGSMWNKSGLC